MTVLVEQSSKTYTGNGATQDFPTTWRFLDSAHLTVVLTDTGGTETTLVEGTHYTVSGEGDAEPGGTVHMLTAPANGETLYIERNTPITQETDLRPEGRFEADDIEDVFDRLTLICQEIRRIAEEAAAIASPATVSAGSIVFASKDFTTGVNDIESAFPFNVAVTGGSTATDAWCTRLQNLDDASEVFDEAPAIQWGPGSGDNVSVKRVSGLKPNTNYRLRIAAVIP